jgi:farnesyl diphosphate synthase
MSAMPLSRSSHRASVARRFVAAEIERLGVELRGSHDRLDDAIVSLLGGESLPPGLLGEAAVDGVPRVRPVLVHLAANAGAARDAADPADALDVACVAEMLHYAIVLHDAALGRQDGRRRRAARRVLRGATAWLGGNALTLRALEVARRAPAPEILGDALDALREVSEGQALHADLQGRAATAADALVGMEARGGAVLSFACKAGGHLGRAERPVVTRLGRYGRHVGVGLHLAEDLAAFELAEDGRPLVRFAECGRLVYPVALASERDAAIAPLWARLGETGDLHLAEDLAGRVRDLGALRAGRERLLGESWAARRALATLPDSSARAALDRIAGGLAQAA